MKTATLPSLRVEPALREAAEDLLQNGETLSGFIEAAVRQQVRSRQLRDEFIKRGLASLEDTKRTGMYYTAEESLGRLDAILASHQTRTKHRT
ncbi:MAG: prevent-host-death protein [Thermomonas sp.]|uniref:YlcI/YnfO family protein n=1 Tax=Thermomonas sp. TaxID=1971895 RepID=UPI001EB5B1D8|nr:YlcI/YnfO family protein [Thermomonas sp.]MBV2208989.1 prevent-host-death protein [Thermomonas sp.]